MLPAAVARRPDASSIAAVRLVTVVFPLVPVTATIGTRARSAARSISLRTETPEAARGNDRGMRFGDEWARDDHRARRGRFGVPVRAGRGEDLRARVEHAAHARVVRVAARVVVGDVDFPPLAAEPARDRLARRGQTDHEGPRHSSPNRRKSA